LAYLVKIAESAARDIRALDVQIKERIKAKLRWLADNAEAIIHHRLSRVAIHEREVFRLRVGDWRVFYLIFHEDREIEVIGVAHRSEVYRNLP